MDKVITQIDEEGILTQDGKLWKYDIYTFEEWNKRYEPNFEVIKD